LTVTAVVETVAGGFAGRGGNRARAAQGGVCAFAVESFDVLPGGHEQLAGVAGGDAEQLDGARRGGRDELLELVVQSRDLTIERLDPLGDRAQGELRGLGGGAQLAGR